MGKISRETSIIIGAVILVCALLGMVRAFAIPGSLWAIPFVFATALWGVGFIALGKD